MIQGKSSSCAVIQGAGPTLAEKQLYPLPFKADDSKSKAKNKGHKRQRSIEELTRDLTIPKD